MCMDTLTNTVFTPAQELRSTLIWNCICSFAMGVINETVDWVCWNCFQGVNPAVLTLRPIGRSEQTSEERILGDLQTMRDEVPLTEEEIVMEERRLSEERRWAEERRVAEEAGGESALQASEADAGEWPARPSELGSGETRGEDSSTEDWSLSSGELAEAEEEQAKADAKRMAEDDEQIAQEERLRLAYAEDRYNAQVTAEIYNPGLQVCCNTLIRLAVRREYRKSMAVAGGFMQAPVRKDNATVAVMDDADVRDQEVVEPPEVAAAAAGENDQPLPMAGPGEMDGDTVPIPVKLVPRNKYDKITSGIEAIPFIEEVADTCKEEVEEFREGAKLYIAIKAAMGGRCVGSYVFVTDMVATTITGFVLASVVDVLYSLWKERKKTREDEAIAAVRAATEAWVNESKAALEAVWAETPLGTSLGPDASQLPTRGRGRGRGRARGSGRGSERGSGRGRGRGRGRGKAGSSPQVAESAGGSAPESVAGGFAEGPKKSETRILPPDISFESDATRNRGSARGRARARGGGRGRGRGRGKTGSSPQVTESVAGGASESVAGGFAQGPKKPETRILPPGISFGSGATRNRGSATGREGLGATQVFAGNSQTAETPILLDKSQVVDNSQLGIMNRKGATEATGSHLQAIEGATGGSSGTPIPPTLDKSLMVDNSQLGKRKRGSVPESTGSHPQATEGTTEGSAGGLNDAETSLPPTLDTSLGSGSQPPTRGRGTGRWRGVVVGRGRASKRARTK